MSRSSRAGNLDLEFSSSGRKDLCRFRQRSFCAREKTRQFLNAVTLTVCPSIGAEKLRRTPREFEIGNAGPPVLILQSIVDEIFGCKPKRAAIHGIHN